LETRAISRSPTHHQGAGSSRPPSCANILCALGCYQQRSYTQVASPPLRDSANDLIHSPGIEVISTASARSSLTSSIERQPSRSQSGCSRMPLQELSKRQYGVIVPLMSKSGTVSYYRQTPEPPVTPEAVERKFRPDHAVCGKAKGTRRWSDGARHAQRGESE
jgi:hypothetical protein